MIQESAGNILPVQRGIQMAETILSVRNMTQQFKGVLAVDHIRMDLEISRINMKIGLLALIMEIMNMSDNIRLKQHKGSPRARASTALNHQ